MATAVACSPRILPVKRELARDSRA